MDFAGEDGEEVAAIPFEGFVFWGCPAGDGGEGGHPVGDVGGGVDLAGFEFGGPTEEGGDADAAFVELAFLASEGVIAGGELAGGVVVGGVFGVVVFGGAAAVVTGEDDEGVLAELGLVEGGEEAADAVVEMHDAGGVLAGDVALDGGGDLVEPGLGFFEGEVDGGVGEVEEEVGVFFAGFDPFDGFGGDEVGDVALFFDQLAVAMPGVGVGAFFVAVVVGADAAAEGAVGVVEAVVVGAPFGFGAEVPFAGEAGLVADLFEGLGEGDGFDWEAAFGLGGGDAEAAPVAAGHESGAGGGADGGDVVVGEFDAFGCEFVEVGGGGVAAVEGYVGPTEVIGDDEDDVGWGGLEARGETGCKGDQDSHGIENAEGVGQNAVIRGQTFWATVAMVSRWYFSTLERPWAALVRAAAGSVARARTVGTMRLIWSSSSMLKSQSPRPMSSHM